MLHERVGWSLHWEHADMHHAAGLRLPGTGSSNASTPAHQAMRGRGAQSTSLGNRTHSCPHGRFRGLRPRIHCESTFFFHQTLAGHGFSRCWTRAARQHTAARQASAPTTSMPLARMRAQARLSVQSMVAGCSWTLSELNSSTSTLLVTFPTALTCQAEVTTAGYTCPPVLLSNVAISVAMHV